MFDIDKSLNKMLGTKQKKVPTNYFDVSKILKKPTYSKKQDWDLDGVPNWKDCQPRNIFRQDAVNWEERKKIPHWLLQQLNKEKKEKAIDLLKLGYTTYEVAEKFNAINPYKVEKRPQIFFSKQQKIEALQTIYRDKNRVPKQHDLKDYPHYPTSAAFVKEFGSWNEAIAQAGFKSRESTQPYKTVNERITTLGKIPTRSEVIKDTQSIPIVKERIKKYEKEYIQRPEVKERIKIYQQRPEVKARIKEHQKEYEQQPEVKVRIKERQTKYYQTEEYKEKERKRNRNRIEYMKAYYYKKKNKSYDNMMNDNDNDGTPNVADGTPNGEK